MVVGKLKPPCPDIGNIESLGCVFERLLTARCISSNLSVGKEATSFVIEGMASFLYGKVIFKFSGTSLALKTKKVSCFVGRPATIVNASYFPVVLARKSLLKSL